MHASTHPQAYVSFLRGINVGGHRKIPMAALRELCQSMGFLKVQSYIQSGNLIFQSALSATECSSLLEQAILQAFGFEVPVITFSKSDFEKVLSEQPFGTTELVHVHLTLLAKETAMKLPLDTLDLRQNKVIQKAGAIYLYCPEGYSNCKVTNEWIERKLACKASTRNLKTLHHLQSMLESCS
jgi:uncharacterized protein (DUF1697 family)